jgi:hypothetical protein
MSLGYTWFITLNVYKTAISFVLCQFGLLSCCSSSQTHVSLLCVRHHHRAKCQYGTLLVGARMAAYMSCDPEKRSGDSPVPGTDSLASSMGGRRLGRSIFVYYSTFFSARNSYLLELSTSIYCLDHLRPEQNTLVSLRRLRLSMQVRGHQLKGFVLRLSNVSPPVDLKWATATSVRVTAPSLQVSRCCTF